MEVVVVITALVTTLMVLVERSLQFVCMNKQLLKKMMACFRLYTSGLKV